MKNVFVITSGLQFVAAKILFATEFKGQDNHAYVFLKKHPNATLGNCTSTYLSNWSSRDYLASVWKFRLSVGRVVGRGAINLYYAHPFHFASNYLLHRREVATLGLLPDGALNYCQCEVNAGQAKKMRIKRLIGLLAGLPYRPYSGPLVGMSVRPPDVMYVFDQDGLYYRSPKVVEISLPMVDKSGIEECCLVIEQDLESIYPVELANELRTTLWRIVEASGLRVLYKPHPQMTRSMVPAEFEHLVHTVAEATSPVEFLIEELRPSMTISFLSSALITIKQIIPDSRCMAVLKTEKVDANLIRMFGNRGIEIVGI